MDLRDYQIKLIQDLKIELFKGNKAICVVSPTGSGKTVVIGKIVKSLFHNNTKVFIVAHRQELISQISNTLENFNIPHGIISPHYKRDNTQLVQVASVDSLVRRLDYYPEPSFIITDECAHLIKNNKWGRVAQKYSNAKLIGFTATPIRTDGTGLGINSGGFFESIILAPQTHWMIDNNYLTPARYFVPPQVADLTGLRKSYGDYNTAQLEERLNKSTITGDAIAHYKRISPNTPAIAFCASIKHAHAVSEEFNNIGIPSATIDGTLDAITRKNLIQDLASGKIKVLTSVDVISEGTDIPVVTTAILLRPTQSLSLHLQQIGRVLRKSPDKKFAYILDHVGNTLKHGFAETQREWTLSGIKKNSRSQEKTIPMRQCPACYCCHAPLPICPSCHHKYQIEFREIKIEKGELHELTKEEKKHFQFKKIQERKKASSLADLKIIEKQRGYKNGWAEHVWKAKLSYKRQ